MSWLSSLFGGGHHGMSSNPANAANSYLDQIPGQYMNPEMYNTIASQYKQSPGYDYRLKQALGGVNNAQAAGGMLGSRQNQKFAAETSEGLADQDFNNYMQQRMGMGDVMGNVTGQKAQYAYGGESGKNQQHAQMIQQLLSLLGIGAGAAGGFMLGGPPGAAAGAAYGNYKTHNNGWMGG